jgi:nicotinamide phosphoribosyltransferase
MKLSKNIILNSDSYKYSQFNQYPAGTEYVYSYIESRGGKWNDTVFFGLQAFIKEYLCEPITQSDIDIASEIITAHGEPFNRDGWEYILREHKGFLPVVIKAVPEGTIVPIKNVLATIENTDPKCFWLTSFLETALLRAIWYPTTVATNSYESKKIILAALEKTGDPATIDFKLHDFGARGVSSMESAGIGGAAHLVNFMGTDTISGILFAREYYNAGVAGFSIPAMEHSTVTSWGKENEVDSYRNMVKQNAKQGGIFAAVSDSYDIYKACELWGTVLKQDVLDSGATLVVRPDSGNPADVVVKCLYILEKYFGSTTNAKGFRVLNPAVRIIQGDGINHASIHSILFCMELAGFSADNVAFGQGGALLQIVDRDTMQWAMKCSAIGVRVEDRKMTSAGVVVVDELEWRDVYKDPVTDTGKRSKRGRVTLWESGGEYQSSVTQPMGWTDKGMKWNHVLEEVYRDGALVKEITFDEVRANARK